MEACIPLGGAHEYGSNLGDFMKLRVFNADCRMHVFPQNLSFLFIFSKHFKFYGRSYDIEQNI